MSGMAEGPAPAAPSFGEELRKEREMRGISLKEIADATKISKRFLEAVERNDMRTLPAPVFTRGFVREYARYLGLNADEMVTRYGDFLRALEEAELAQQADPMRGAPLPPRPAFARSEPEPQPLRKFIAVAVGAAVIGAAIVLLFTRARHKEASVQRPVPAAVPAAGTLPARPPATATATDLTLQLNFTEKTYIDVSADGKPVVHDETFAAGDSKIVHGRDEIVVNVIGNAGGVELTLNGSRLPPLGASGKVKRNIRFDRTSLAAR